MGMKGEIDGVRVCREATIISHLLFALILINANKKNADKLKNSLNEYCLNFGQKVSVEKYSVFFSANTEVGIREEVCDILDIMT
jgi:predicted amino acid-binding ACT domain protein